MFPLRKFFNFLERRKKGKREKRKEKERKKGKKKYRKRLVSQETADAFFKCKIQKNFSKISDILTIDAYFFRNFYRIIIMDI